jgi:hypothetical protein
MIMLTKCIAIGGQPAVGKTTLVKQFFINFSPWKAFKYKKLYGHYNEELNLVILGKYSASELFSGTDKLSMSVQPDFEEFIMKYKSKDTPPKYNVLFEGDRLFNKKSIDLVHSVMWLDVFIVESVNTNKRHIDRNDTQSEKFIKGRVTKTNNIKNYLLDDYTILINNDEEDIEKNYMIILNTLMGDY